MANECDAKLVTVTQGADKTFFINLTISEDGQPAKAFPLEAVPTIVEVRFPDINGAVLRLNLGAKVLVDDAAGGRLKILMAEVDTNLLLASDDLQDIEVQVVQNIPVAGTTKFFLFERALKVKAQRFP